jgi:peptide deformylase
VVHKQLQLRLYPDAVLRTKAASVKEVNGAVRGLMEVMRSFMAEHKAIGLAAPQVGIVQRVVVADIGDGLLALANPEIFSPGDEEFLREGCLSLPNIQVNVPRPRSIVVRGLNADGKQVDQEVQGLMARVVQHEIDHLNGVLIIDHGPAVVTIGDVRHGA